MIIFEDGFSHYGDTSSTARTNMLSGVWADLPSSNPPVYGGVPSWGARTVGSLAMSNHGNTVGPRLALPSTYTALLVSCGFSMANLPAGDDLNAIVNFRTAANTAIAYVSVESNGQVSLRSSSGTILAQTAGPAIVAQTWQFIDMKIDTVAGTFELYVDDPDEPVINVSGLSLVSAAIGQLRVIDGAITVQNDGTPWLTDLRVRDTAGDYNNDFDGDIRIATLFPNNDTEVAGWTARPRKKLGTGILDNRANTNACVTAASSVQTDLGSGDFTIEQFVRFSALPTGSNKAQLFGKWDETNNRRSYQLYMGGPSLESGTTVFRISTDGQAGTVQEIFQWPWVPELNRWYHVAVSRASGETLFFIDGVQQGLPAADANTYFAGTAPTAIGAQCEGTTNAIANTALNGFIDEVRLTVGLCRYDSNFAPPTVPLPRNSTDDPDFADVALLCGFDSGINDESSFGRLVTARGGAVQNTPDDGEFAYQTINQHTPRDDTFIEAALIPAEGVFTLTGLPTAAKIVTVGTTDGSTPAVYKFVAAVATAFDVLIGVDADDTVANLVAAINAAAGAGTLYGTGTTANFDVSAKQLPVEQLLVTANTPGTAGNAIASTTNEPNGSWGGATLSGGEDIPGPSEFSFDRLPPETTVIRSVTVFTRNFKSDTGTCSMQSSFVGPHGAATDGADNSIGTNPSYYQDHYETDPDTGVDLTPTTIIGGRVRVNRTT